MRPVRRMCRLIFRLSTKNSSMNSVRLAMIVAFLANFFGLDAILPQMNYCFCVFGCLLISLSRHIHGAHTHTHMTSVSFSSNYQSMIFVQKTECRATCFASTRFRALQYSSLCVDCWLFVTILGNWWNCRWLTLLGGKNHKHFTPVTIIVCCLIFFRRIFYTIIAWIVSGSECECGEEWSPRATFRML